MKRPRAAPFAGLRSAARGSARPLRVLVSRGALGFDEARSLERSSFARDWFGVAVGTAAGFTLALDRDRLWYVAGCAQSPDHDAALPAGAFAEGLWRRDVAELFIGRAGSPAYRELNVSPGGAWWTCVFSGYRRPDQRAAAPPAGVATFIDIGPASWVAGLAVPRGALGLGETVPNGTLLNACMIAGGADRRHLCWQPAAGEPDFHAAACFASVELVPID